jgi:hypothetical protein
VTATAITLGWLLGAYLAAAIVAVARKSSRLSKIILLDVLLGWSVIGWIWALALAVEPARARDEDVAERAEALVEDLLASSLYLPDPDPAIEGETIYLDGTYLISVHDDARTWGVCEEGRWGVVYERSGVQAVASWVLADDIPVDVRARALRPAGVTPDGGHG